MYPCYRSIEERHDQYFNVQFMQDCQSWHDYSLYVYQCGIEALFHQYHTNIKKLFNDDIVLESTKKIEHHISLHFTNEEVKQRFESEENQGGFIQYEGKDPYKKERR